MPSQVVAIRRPIACFTQTPAKEAGTFELDRAPVPSEPGKGAAAERGDSREEEMVGRGTGGAARSASRLPLDPHLPE
jgi:hypothetical protein